MFKNFRLRKYVILFFIHFEKNEMMYSSASMQQLLVNFVACFGLEASYTRIWMTFQLVKMKWMRVITEVRRNQYLYNVFFFDEL